MKEGIFFLSGFILTVMVIPWIKKLSFNIGYLDSPEGDLLKIHTVPVPHSGGAAIFGIFSLLLLFISTIGKENAIGLELAGLFLAGAMAFSLGVWEDLKTLRPAIRLGGEALVGIVLILFGHRIQAPLFITLPLTLFYVVGAINAINMDDGLDGLAGGMVLISCVGFAFLSMMKGQAVELMVSSILIGVLIGFLFYNFTPSSIFMGDNGSYFLGFILAYLVLSFTSIEYWSAFFGPIFIVGMPIFDAAYAILRRLKKGVSPLAGDRSHFYDQLMERGLSVRQTVLVCWGIQAVLVGFGIAIYPAA